MGFVVFLNAVVVTTLGALMAAVALVFPDSRGVFALAAFGCTLVGAAVSLATLASERRIDRLHAFVLTASVWLTASATGAVPLVLFGLTPTDAVFEAMSGITTTGSTVMAGLDGTDRGILFWRALLQGIGGVGFIVTGIALLPILRVGGMQLFRTESSERGDKELASAARFAAATLWIYLTLMALCALVYALGGMSAFDAVTHALTTLSTGGYSTYDSSFGHFQSSFLHWTATFFMLAGALPFAWYIRVARRGPAQSEQVRAFAAGLVLVVLALTGWLVATADIPPLLALRDVAFNVVSVVTTTGYATTDYTLWGPPAVAAFFVLTAIGGCTGSTSGGVKTMRWIILARCLAAQVRTLHDPHGIHLVRYERRTVPVDQITGVIAFFSFFFFSFTVLATALAMLGLDFETSVSGALTALCNVGPGVGPIIGPAGNFATLPDPAKWVLTLGMYLGRLEMLTVFVLLMPSFWRELA